MAEILSCYEPLADHYHLIFDDWDAAIKRQAGILNRILAANGCAHPLKMLDCACGIGTQALGFAALGYQVVASDLSQAAVNRARREAQTRALDIQFYVSDMTSLIEIADHDFDVVAALDNALPHLSPDQLASAMKAAASKLKSNGIFIASIRDYDTLMLKRPSGQDPAFYGKTGERRIVHQVWDWIDHTRYTWHLFIVTESNQVWTTHHFVSEYRCLLRDELSRAASQAGFHHLQWLMPSDTGFYQPIFLAWRP